MLAAVGNVRGEIAEALEGFDAFDQRLIDLALVDLDGTPTKSRLGANAILGVSLAVAKAAADELDLPLYRYLGGVDAHVLPVPMMNVLNGGVHADNNVDFQEFMIVPARRGLLRRGACAGASRPTTPCKACCTTRGLGGGVGDEGGFAPNLETNEEALTMLVAAIEKAGRVPGDEIAIALDPAASEFYSRTARYVLAGEGRTLAPAEFAALLGRDLSGATRSSRSRTGWPRTTGRAGRPSPRRVGDRVQLVGDDLFVTNVERVERGIRSARRQRRAHQGEPDRHAHRDARDDAAGAATPATAASSRTAPGETEDTTIADLAVATNCGQIKTGAPARSDRVAKYNQLLRIEDELGEAAEWPGCRPSRGPGGRHAVKSLGRARLALVAAAVLADRGRGDGLPDGDAPPPADRARRGRADSSRRRLAQRRGHLGDREPEAGVDDRGDRPRGVRARPARTALPMSSCRARAPAPWARGCSASSRFPRPTSCRRASSALAPPVLAGAGAKPTSLWGRTLDELEFWRWVF